MGATQTSECAAVRIDAGDLRYPPRLRERLGESAPETIVARGNLALLDRPDLAIFSSRRCPGRLLLRAYDLGQEIRARGIPIIGGFQSPAEEEVRIMALRGDGPIILCPAHDIAQWRIPVEYRSAMESGRLLILSPFADGPRRSNEYCRERRNRFAAALASGVLVVHAHPESNTMKLAREIVAWGVPVYALRDEANANLIELGAKDVGIEELARRVDVVPT